MVPGGVLDGLGGSFLAPRYTMCVPKAQETCTAAHQVYHPVGLARGRAARPRKASPSWRVGKWSVPETHLQKCKHCRVPPGDVGGNPSRRWNARRTPTILSLRTTCRSLQLAREIAHRKTVPNSKYVNVRGKKTPRLWLRTIHRPMGLDFQFKRKLCSKFWPFLVWWHGVRQDRGPTTSPPSLIVSPLSMNWHEPRDNDTVKSKTSRGLVQR